jgi:hypothetical protein
VFVTSGAFFGSDIGSALAADGRCQSAANGARTTAALRNRKWQAWLSDGASSVVNRLTHGRKPYWLPGNILVANDWPQLTSFRLLHAIDVDESGTTLTAGPKSAVWTGTNANGMLLPERCAEWKVDGVTGSIGHAYAVGADWSFAGVSACIEGHRLYCIEQ